MDKYFFLHSLGSEQEFQNSFSMSSDNHMCSFIQIP